MYKCNSRNEDYQSGVGDWRTFFDEGERRWGGAWSTKNPASMKIISEELKPGDFIFCYQTDRREIVGLCKLLRFVHVPSGDMKGRNLYLRVVEEFEPPVKIHMLKKKVPGLRRVRALIPGPIQTIYRVNQTEAALLLNACGAMLMADGTPRRPRKGGRGGFGDPKQKAEVEKRAVRCVVGVYRRKGWRVKSREKENLGFDLECRKGAQIEHVEVKGFSGEIGGFILTAREFDQMEHDRRFVLALVGGALSGSPRVARMEGADARKSFAFHPHAYTARWR